MKKCLFFLCLNYKAIERQNIKVPVKRVDFSFLNQNMGTFLWDLLSQHPSACFLVLKKRKNLIL